MTVVLVHRVWRLWNQFRFPYRWPGRQSARLVGGLHRYQSRKNFGTGASQAGRETKLDSVGFNAAWDATDNLGFGLIIITPSQIRAGPRPMEVARPLAFPRSQR